MKVISFSAVEILPALLDRSKTQTLRPAWKEDAYLRCNDISKEINPNKYFKEPRFKVGEKVKFMWKCRSKYQWFCKNCGDSDCFNMTPEIPFAYAFGCPNCKGEHKLFHKIIGTGTITEVFEIEMGIKKGEVKYSDRTEIREYQAIEGVGRQLFFNDRYVELPQMDGFKSTEELFRYFDKAYGLDSPKRFYVYRWVYD